MLDFGDKPYRHFPPKRSPVMVRIASVYNRYIELPRTQRIKSLSISGEEDLNKQRQDSDKLLLIVNHPTHHLGSV